MSVGGCLDGLMLRALEKLWGFGKALHMKRILRRRKKLDFQKLNCLLKQL